MELNGNGEVIDFEFLNSRLQEILGQQVSLISLQQTLG